VIFHGAMNESLQSAYQSEVIHWLVDHTLSFENVTAFQASWTFKLYPPLPGLPASPSGFGILMASDSIELKEDSVEEPSDMSPPSSPSATVDEHSGTG